MSRLLKVSFSCCQSLTASVGGRDLHISSPGVAWDDIAGLEDAKRVLQENVILPLLMPDYFQGIRRPVKVGDQELSPSAALQIQIRLPSACQETLAACCSIQ